MNKAVLIAALALGACAHKERGATDEQIHQMHVDNPRRIFERQGGY